MNPLSPSFAAMGDVLTCFDEYLTASERWSSDYDALALENALIHAHARTRMDDAARVHREAVADRSAPLPRHWFDFMPASPLSPTWPFGDADLEARLLQSSPHPPTAEDRTSAPPRSSLDRRRRDDFPARPPALRVVADDPSARRSPRDDWSIGDLLKSPLEAIVTGTPLLASLSKTVRGWREPSPAAAFARASSARLLFLIRLTSPLASVAVVAIAPSFASFVIARIAPIARTSSHAFVPRSYDSVVPRRCTRSARRASASPLSAAMALRRFGAGPSAADAAAALRETKKPRPSATPRRAPRSRRRSSARIASRRRSPPTGRRVRDAKQFDRFDDDATARGAARARGGPRRDRERRGRSGGDAGERVRARGGGSAADDGARRGGRRRRGGTGERVYGDACATARGEENERWGAQGDVRGRGARAGRWWRRERDGTRATASTRARTRCESEGSIE